MEREALKEEALKRMELIGLPADIISALRDGDTIYHSKAHGVMGRLLPAEEAVIERFEKDTDAFVYHVICSENSFGRQYTLLQVSPFEEDWEEERNDLKEGQTLAYVENVSHPDWSEFGTVFFKTTGAGLVRTS